MSQAEGGSFTSPQPSITRAAAAGILAAALAVWLPVLAIPAVVAVVLLCIQQQGRSRLAVVTVGGLLALVALTRFTVSYAVPNIALTGQANAEKQAVSMLREIWWAEALARQHRVSDADGNGSGEYLFMGQLMGMTPVAGGDPLPVPLLREDMFLTRQLPGGTGVVHERDGYMYTVYLPGADGKARSEGESGVDATRAATTFVAYAWPVIFGQTGNKAFFIDSLERICETTNTAQRYQAVTRVPGPYAALGGNTLDATPCGTGQDGATWKTWKNKKPRTMPP